MISSQDQASRTVSCFFPIFLFALVGFEHCIANQVPGCAPSLFPIHKLQPLISHRQPGTPAWAPGRNASSRPTNPTPPPFLRPMQFYVPTGLFYGAQVPPARLEIPLQARHPLISRHDNPYLCTYVSMYLQMQTTWGDFFLHNLIPAAIGNFIGGAVICGGSMQVSVRVCVRERERVGGRSAAA